MPIPGTDSGLLAPTWAGSPAEDEVTDEAFLRAMLETEAALARAQASLGLVPEYAAKAISDAAERAQLNLVALARQGRAAANPVVALVPAFTAMIAADNPDAAEFVHRGSTSQDILDSACMLVADRTLRLVTGDLERTARAFAALARTHRDTLQAGRTLTQHAVPVTFGLKAATWLQLALDALVRVRSVALPAELGGAAGTLAAYGEYAALDGPDRSGLPLGGVELMAPFAAELGLAEPVLSWHTARTPIADLGAVLQFVTGALGKFALDVQTLSRPEIGEVSEPSAPGRGASSAMPQKCNPVLATLVVTAARQVPAHALVLAQSMLAEDERPGGAWHAEWQPLREALRLTGGAAHLAAELAEGLRVHPDRMLANVRLTDGAIVAERLNVALAPALGKATAKRVLTEASLMAAASGKPLADVLTERADLVGVITAEQLTDLLDPARYVGAAGPLIDRVLSRASALGVTA
ncbi:class-II fumarase/aspartase family protein [Kibdelosporangium phytohabitans]|uniref:3-carboxy-cis,cis-muconate cycloisomerase n=1 Tax=Kibdelosporangium phytohabitans TaxID=860235 RepID=A0A0N9HY73_9PSEU|nr:adenylosuccinate lyase family protein [Kibdelosporangium phytohabitans]ALG08566.1 3-carboxy-cis,cis-muconate cycloisomerase [Kibdelosporangium phytohabitans]MBE1470355.1 3-carboxy-cis,cis-muconate cycloisomerase [Kibdelosporangium phytohabitans]